MPQGSAIMPQGSAITLQKLAIAPQGWQYCRESDPILGEGGWFVIFLMFKSILFLSIEFHCTFSIIKYYHIFFIIIVFRLGSDKLVSCFFYCLSQGISHRMWLLAWERGDGFLFSIIQVHFVFCQLKFIILFLSLI